MDINEMMLEHDELVKRHCNHAPEAFDAFWAAYPRKIDKVRTMRAWDKLRLPDSEIAEMMRYLELYITYVRRMNDGASDDSDEFKDISARELNAVSEYRWDKGGGFASAEAFLVDQPWFC